MKQNRVIKITEKQYKKYLLEGVTYTKQDPSQNNAPIDFSINQDMSDKANTGANSVDTRVFGSKNDILNGDGTAHKRNKSLTQLNNSKLSAIKFYQSIIEYVKKWQKR